MNKVKTLRLLNDLSQNELAVRSNLSRQTIHKIENGKTKQIGRVTMENIANAFHKTVAEVFYSELEAQKEEVV